MIATSWEEVSALATIAGAAGGFAALFLAWHQVRRQVDDIAKQRSLQSQAAQLAAKGSISQSYGQISQHMADVSRHFLEHPEWFPYFYEKRGAPLGDKELSHQLEIMCESLMDFVDSVVEQRRTVPRGRMDWSTWESYFRSLYDCSPVLQKYVADSLGLYPDYVFAALGLIVVRNTLTGHKLGAWRARELAYQPDDPEDGEEVKVVASDRALLAAVFGDERPKGGAPGYPWVRTWVVANTEKQGPVFVASVEVAAATLARVHIGWRGARNIEAEETLLAWVIGTLASSSLLEQAEVVRYPVTPGAPSQFYEVLPALEHRPDQPVDNALGTEEGNDRRAHNSELFLVPPLQSAPPSSPGEAGLPP